MMIVGCTENGMLFSAQEMGLMNATEILHCIEVPGRVRFRLDDLSCAIVSSTPGRESIFNRIFMQKLQTWPSYIY